MTFVLMLNELLINTAPAIEVIFDNLDTQSITINKGQK